MNVISSHKEVKKYENNFKMFLCVLQVFSKMDLKKKSLKKVKNTFVLISKSYSEQGHKREFAKTSEMTFFVANIWKIMMISRKFYF